MDVDGFVAWLLKGKPVDHVRQLLTTLGAVIVHPREYDIEVTIVTWDPHVGLFHALNATPGLCAHASEVWVAYPVTGYLTDEPDDTALPRAVLELVAREQFERIMIERVTLTGVDKWTLDSNGVLDPFDAGPNQLDRVLVRLLLAPEV